MLFQLLSSLPAEVRNATASLCIDGTSATALLLDARGRRVLAPPKLYNESQSAAAVSAAAAVAPPSHTATAGTSTLCKLLAWHLDGTWQAAAQSGAHPLLLHQADWLGYLLHGVCVCVYACVLQLPLVSCIKYFGLCWHW